MKIFIVTFFLCSLSATTSAYVQTKLINNVSLALEDVYNYFLKHGKANLGGFKGVLLSKAILEGTNANVVDTTRLRKMATKVLFKLRNDFTQVLDKEPSNISLLPKLEQWQKTVKFGINTLDEDYTNLYVVLDAYEFLKEVNRASFSKMFYESCLTEILSAPQATINQCKISAGCRNVLINSSSIYTGISAINRVRYLQTLRLVGCVEEGQIQQHIQKYCSYIMWEVQNVEELHLTDLLYGILFEQITLCGMEGYSDFMQTIFLYHTLKIKSPKEGCYKIPTPTKELENKIVYKYVCADRTTGMAASVLALYLKYFAQQFS